MPEGGSLFTLLGEGGALKAVVYGALWGVGGLTFGLSMRYLGGGARAVDLAGHLLGLRNAPPGAVRQHGPPARAGLILLLGVCVTLAGIAVIGYAGSLRAADMTEEEKRAAIKVSR